MSVEGCNHAYLSLGSNIRPEHNLPAAVHELSRFGTVVAASRVWESAPLGYAAQPNFLNAAVLLATDLSADDLYRRAISEVETHLGRQRDPDNPNGPRTIDIDVALFNHEILSVEHRHIPDPDICERAFLAVVLAELCPGYRHPETKQTLQEIADSLTALNFALQLRGDVALL